MTNRTQYTFRVSRDEHNIFDSIQSLTSEYDETIDGLETNIKDLETTIKELNETINEKDLEISRLENLVATLENGGNPLEG